MRSLPGAAPRALALASVLTVVLALAACGADGERDRERAGSAGGPPPSGQSTASSPAPYAAGPRTTVPITVPAGLGAPPFDKPRQLQLPAGWMLLALTTWAIGAKSRKGS
jgi:hypothetical protein